MQSAGRRPARWGAQEELAQEQVRLVRLYLRKPAHASQNTQSCNSAAVTISPPAPLHQPPVLSRWWTHQEPPQRTLARGRCWVAAPVMSATYQYRACCRGSTIRSRASAERVPTGRELRAQLAYYGPIRDRRNLSSVCRPARGWR